MSTRSVAEFESSLVDLGVTRTRTTAEAFEDDLQEAIHDPVVGVPISINGVSFGDLPVTTNPTPAELDAARTGVTAAEFAVAPYGTVVVADAPDGDDPMSLFPDRHVAVVRESDILDSMAAAFDRLGPLLRDERRGAILATGPSATADMGSLVKGVHGPKEVHVLVVSDR